MLTVEKSTFGPINVVCFDGWKFNDEEYYVSVEMDRGVIEIVYVGKCSNNVITDEIAFEKTAGTIGWSIMTDGIDDTIESDSGDPVEYVQQNGLELSAAGKTLLTVYKQIFDELYKFEGEAEYVAVAAQVKEFMTV